LARIIRIGATREANLKQRLRRHLRKLGLKKVPDGGYAPEGTDKAIIRSLHVAQRTERLAVNRDFLQDNYAKLTEHFASGVELQVDAIKPMLRRVRSDTWESDLFRLAALSWSVPVSNGFGRRLRYLVWDDHHDKLIGLIAIGDPVFNLAVRDNLIGWNVKDRGARLVNIMDAYVLGAVPPYNMLLGGKLVASLVRTREIYDDFQEEYGATRGIISGEEKRARLVAITTSSSMGRSSVYNRLKLDGVHYFESIGYTGGWGHFHIPDALFADLREYLREKNHKYADLHRFGEGPNWRLRTTRAALDALGFRGDMLKHGIKREVFLCCMADNAISLLKKGKGKPDISGLLGVDEVARLALDRWIVPRSERDSTYLTWRREAMAGLLGNPARSRAKSEPGRKRAG
jgi:hypothetical protein